MNISKDAAAKKKFTIFRSLRFKAVFLMGFVVAGVALLSAFYFSRHAKRLIFDSAMERLTAIGDTFAFDAEYGLLLKDREILSKRAKGVALQQDILSAIVMDSTGAIISREPQPLNAESQKKSGNIFRYFQNGMIMS